MTRDEFGRITDLEKCLGNGFLEIENPARYLGSEYIHNRKQYSEGDVRCAMCFPDLYEIGMANNAVPILYDIINRTEGAFCDRVFAVAPDFEAMLREKEIPLFTPETPELPATATEPDLPAAEPAAESELPANDPAEPAPASATV